MAKTLQTTMLQGIRQLWNDIGESYFFMAQQLYSKGRRVFTDSRGTFQTVVNETLIDDSGEEEVINDFGSLARHRVVISEAPAGVNNRLAQRELNGALAQNYAQIAPNASMTFIENLIRSVDMDQIQKESAMEGVSLDRERLAIQTQAEIVNAQVAIQQAQQLLQQSQQPQPGPGGGLPPQGGALAEGGLAALPPPEQAVPPELAGGAQPELPSGLSNPATEQSLSSFQQ